MSVLKELMNTKENALSNVVNQVQKMMNISMQILKQLPGNVLKLNNVQVIKLLMNIKANVFRFVQGGC